MIPLKYGADPATQAKAKPHVRHSSYFKEGQELLFQHFAIQ
jgi:hypothetical protein